MSTPMQKQYNKLKKQYEDCILLFRLGDFYEGFNNDAKILSKVLGIVLTSRGKGDKRQPMAGIPYHALDNYLPKLVAAGYKVAIVEQLEEPQKDKKIVDRDVVKVVTPGTITSEKSLHNDKNNFLASVVYGSDKKQSIWALSVCDLTTGEYYLSEFYTNDQKDVTPVISELSRINPAELLVSKEHAAFIKCHFKVARIQEIEEYDLSYTENKKILMDHFHVRSLKGFGIDTYKTGIIASGTIMKFLKDTQKVQLEHITRIYYKNFNSTMLLDENTIRSLELVTPIRNAEQQATLLSILDKCLTPMGKRKLYSWILHPLKNILSIKRRLDAVDVFFQDALKLDELRAVLDNIVDIERILGKIGTKSVNARDLLGLKFSLESALDVEKHMITKRSLLLKGIKSILNKSTYSRKVIRIVENAIDDNPPNTITEGGIIKQGYHNKLDTIRSSSRSGKEWLQTLQKDERERTGIQSLKVKYNKVFGYYIEVSKANLDKVPEDYIRKQTLVNAERFITPELKEKEDMILNADGRAVDLEYKIFCSIRDEILKYVHSLQELSDVIAILDCITSFSHISRNNEYIKPEILRKTNGKIEVKDGRHPVVEQIQEEAFIANDVELDNENKQLAIITGPNMAGKSTYIRQVALQVLMAQIGCFVPASKMKFTPVDRIFTRVGASDNIAGGESTFLVEMNESAHILNNATKNSLIILDEVGRGTSTYDGVAIAWAVAEYIHEKIGAKTLFATHYHELVDLKKYLKRAINLNVSVQESKGKIVFLRTIEKGGTNKSYGVHVAEFAGIPKEVIKKAKEILMSLEQEGMFEVNHVESELVEKQKSSIPPQMPLLTELPEHPVIKELEGMDINKMTPLQALEKLSEIINKSKTT